MKQIVTSAKGIKVIESPLPTPGDNEILVAVYTSVISTGTETMGMKKTDMALSEKLLEKKLLLDKVHRVINEKGLNTAIKAIRRNVNPAEQGTFFKPIGYSNAGIVISKGRLVKNFNPGDRVACAGAGIASHAEFVTVPVNLAVKIPNGVSFESAGFTTIGAISMQGLRRANVTFGETVVVTGLGLLGLIAVQIAKAWGLVVIGTDLNHQRLVLAKELGADYCFDAHENDLVQKIREVTHGYGADAVIIYASTKKSEPANQALEVCRRKGRVVVVGSIGMDLKRDAMYSKELDFVMSTSYGPGRYDDQYELKGIDYPIGYVRWTENRNMIEFLRLLDQERVKVETLISKRYEIEQAAEAYKVLSENPGDNISFIFNYLHEEKVVPKSRMEVYPMRTVIGKIGVGIIGAGSFIQKNHLANILAMPEAYHLVGVAEKTPVSARTISEKYKVNYITTDYKQLLNDKDISLIIIGTRHNLHASQVSDAIKAGKHVLVEKPLAMSHDELSMIEEAFQQNPDVIAAVGFNRRYSPLVQKAVQIIRTNKSPVVINYRVNAGYFSPDVWVQDLEEGGGRIIGEVCHFVDLVAYLVSTDINKINAIFVPRDGKSIHSDDNLIVTMSFSNGSIGVITYTSLGGKSMEKERIEIFTGLSSMVINDFTEMLFFNCEEKNIRLKNTDKGHHALISEFSKRLSSQESLILPFRTDIEMTRTTLLIAEQLQQLTRKLEL